jgi:asparagine synthetase B (glutamine-hydrolysing)
MCSFLYSTRYNNENLEKINFYLKFRGPDHTSMENINGDLFIHNLLSITGKFKKQPYKKDDVILLYNGEIYNYKEFGDFSCDVECIIPLYKRYKRNFIKHLDGEFALCLVDYKENEIIVSSDVFKTKPIFIAYDDTDFACSTYRTPLELLGFKGITKLKPNTTYFINYRSRKIMASDIVYDFDINQKKSNFDDWNIAFEESIKKRIITNKKIFIGLSSGYDSGIIYNELLRNKTPFSCFSLLGKENEKIIDERLKLKNENVYNFKIERNIANNLLSKLTIKNKTEPFRYTIQSDNSDYHELNRFLTEDEGSVNLATICRWSKLNDCKVCLSGTGSDEIISDYGFKGEKKFPHSNFGGLFPKNLNKIFPWGSFYGSTMESYLAKEEYVGGCFGIEMRYPFLDKKLVQEFLWLKHTLKNKEYKSPIDFYFKKHNFPYEKNIKIGF